MKVFRLYLFSWLEQCSQDDLFPGAWALTAEIALFLLVSVCCYLLMFQDCGEDVTLTKGTLSLGIIKYGKCFVPGCLLCGFHVCLGWWAFPFCFTGLPGLPFPQSLCSLRLGTEAVAQPLQFGALCRISPFRSYHVLNCPLPGNLFEYFMFEWRGMGAWGWAKDFLCDMRHCGILWDRGHSVLLASGLHSAIKESFRIAAKSECRLPR